MDKVTRERINEIASKAIDLINKETSGSNDVNEIVSITISDQLHIDRFLGTIDDE